MRRNEGVVFQLFHRSLALGGVELIRFGCHHNEGRVGLPQKLQHHFIVRRGSDAAVHQLDHQLQKVEIGVLREKAVGECRPLCLVLGAALCEAVAGEIDEKELFIHVVEVDRDGFSGAGADARQRFAS